MEFIGFIEFVESIEFVELIKTETVRDTIEIHGDSFRYAGNTSERLGIGEWGLPTVYYRKRREELGG